MRYLKWLVVISLVVLVASDSFAQSRRGGSGGDGGSRGRGRGGPGMRGGPPKMDPERIWRFVSRGKNSIKISDMRMGRTEAEAWAKKNGITNGEMTKGQFVKYFKSRMEERERRAKLPPEKQGALYFTERDRNKNGYIDADEMSGGMRYRLKEYDKNGDGKMSKSETVAYYTKRMEQWRKGRDRSKSSTPSKTKGETQRIIIEEIPYERPLVFAFGKMPNGTPDWYTDNDTDKDGQVALYEWRKSGQSIAEFLKRDTNQDGLISPDEMVRREEQTTESTEARSTSSSSRSSSNSRDRGRGSSRYRGRGR
ncbi:MAG: hypothetical protein ACFCD0_08295 [Gemmataceae bacterium]